MWIKYDIIEFFTSELQGFWVVKGKFQDDQPELFLVKDIVKFREKLLKSFIGKKISAPKIKYPYKKEKDSISLLKEKIIGKDFELRAFLIEKFIENPLLLNNKKFTLQ